MVLKAPGWDEISHIYSKDRRTNVWFCVCVLSRVQLFAIPWTVACLAPLSMEFSRQEHWSGLPIPSPGDLPDSGIKPWSPATQVDSLPSEPPGKPGRPILAITLGSMPPHLSQIASKHVNIRA